MTQLIRFDRASILCYRLYDIAQEIDLEHARRLLSEDTRRLRLARAGSEYLQLPNPPLAMSLGSRALALRAGPVEAEATARLFDHGAASIVLRVPIPPGSDLDQATLLANELYDSPAIERLCLDLLEGLRRTIAPASENPHLWEQSESYTVVFAEAIEGQPSAAELLAARADLARLLLGEAVEPLSERERADVTGHHFSYTERDLVIVDWNSAFVYEPSGSLDIPDVLEICNAQLLELRFYDHQLDGQLQRTYTEIQTQKRRWYSVVRSPYRTLLRRVMSTLMELSEFVERVENSLKIIGDFYLAKVYESAVKRLRIPAWQASVTRKQQMLWNVYNLLKGEVDTDRLVILEAAIVLLIVLDILMVLFAPLTGGS